jgi:hypothetical protein
VRQVIDGLTVASLDGHTEAVWGPGWPEPRSYPVLSRPGTGVDMRWQAIGSGGNGSNR